MLAFKGKALNESGKFVPVRQANTIKDAEARARELRSDLQTRGVHPDVLAFCITELLQNDYFHPVLETPKSVAHKMRGRTGLLDEGGILVQHVYGGSTPVFAIYTLKSKSERGQQKGFCNLVTGVFGLFRNPTYGAGIQVHQSLGSNLGSPLNAFGPHRDPASVKRLSNSAV